MLKLRSAFFFDDLADLHFKHAQKEGTIRKRSQEAHKEMHQTARSNETTSIYLLLRVCFLVHNERADGTASQHGVIARWAMG